MATCYFFPSEYGVDKTHSVRRICTICTGVFFFLCGDNVKIRHKKKTNTLLLRYINIFFGSKNFEFSQFYAFLSYVMSVFVFFDEFSVCNFPSDNFMTQLKTHPPGIGYFLIVFPSLSFSW
jgi:hypothetical protein